MALAAKQGSGKPGFLTEIGWLQDVEQQLQRVKQVVQLHVKLAEAAVKVKATTFAVPVLTSYQAMSQKPSWLIQLVGDLTDVQNAAKDTDLARVLSPVEKCRDDLIVYCSRNDRDALDDMSNYVVLIGGHRGVQANRLLPYLLTLLRKFICDYVDYTLRQDVVGEAPRSASQWVQFSEIGVALANSMCRIPPPSGVEYAGTVLKEGAYTGSKVTGCLDE
ncbi:hypothetical protein PHYSODRAFT_327426 [Phytophthora sojae]|uniref:Uncharacterized protein n=1 Tax=Phytophthora sojae (strain P6497) TaxID=1094619 RepID=G4Z8T0_PHYSP|nr:hypothetical protein PHYSODRAFT_327426 [Phytophthora sojae]EGZ19112.1 hypothetical protein PHYSODRAFT_327426 [Phytophthora sojae]|eukprot:XP_009521829.1 hypothetical protein PHYSODRAFT_327426 [Phytophthora sojae]